MSVFFPNQEVLKCLVVRIRNPGNSCLWNPGLWNPKIIKDNGIPLTIGIRNPRSTNNESRTQCLESGIPSVGSRIQGRFPFTQATSSTTSSPHFSPGIVERAKQERAWKSTHARISKTRRGERKTHFSLSTPHVSFSRVGWFSRALTFRSLYYHWGEMGTIYCLRSSTWVVCVNGKYPWILDPTLGIPDSRYWVLDSLLVERGFRIPDLHRSN